MLKPRDNSITTHLYHSLPSRILLSLKPVIAVFLAIICIHTAQGNQAGIQLTLEDADIRDLVRWASEHTGRNIILHPDVRGQVTLLAGDPMSPEEAYSVFLSVLDVYGFAAVESGGSLKILPAALASTASSAGDRQSERPEDIVVKTVRTRHVPAEKLAGILTPLLSRNAVLSIHPESNLITLSERAYNLERVLDIIDRLDTPHIIEIEVVELDYAGAEDVRRIITEMIPDIARSTSANPRGFVLSADSRSNSLLMSGDSQVREEIKKLIRRLDQPKAGEGHTQVIFVNYAKADSLVPTLKSLSGNYQNRSRLDKGQPEEDVQIEVNTEINALIITAPPPLFAIMKDIVAQLDVRRAQVLVEALIVEVNEEVLRSLGVEWRTNLPTDGTFSGFSALPAGADVPGGSALGSGLTLGFLSSGELRAVIRALEVESAVNILSAPTVVALDNEEAEILVGANVPFITGRSTGAASGTENPFQTIERQDIGVTLKILPRINNDDSITLEVLQTVENIAPTTTNTSDIVTNKRNIKTKVLIEDDEVLVLGGLINDQITEVVSRVPVLGRIPVMGRLFRSNSTEVTKQNLMVFIHPRILRTAQQKGAATRHYYQNFRALQAGQNSERDIITILPAQQPLLPPMENGESKILISPSRIRGDPQLQEP